MLLVVQTNFSLVDRGSSIYRIVLKAVGGIGDHMRFAGALLVLVMSALLAAASQAQLTSPASMLGDVDKINHVIGFAAASMLAFVQTTKRRMQLLQAIWFLMLGLAIEWAQTFSPARKASSADVLADIVGVLLGFGLAFLFRALFRRLRRHAPVEALS